MQLSKAILIRFKSNNIEQKTFFTPRPKKNVLQLAAHNLAYQIKYRMRNVRDLCEGFGRLIWFNYFLGISVLNKKIISKLHYPPLSLSLSFDPNVNEHFTDFSHCFGFISLLITLSKMRWDGNNKFRPKFLS